VQKPKNFKDAWEPKAEGGKVGWCKLKPVLKAPCFQRLKLKYDKLLSSFAFNFDLRRYIKGGGKGILAMAAALLPGRGGPPPQAAAARMPTIGSAAAAAAAGVGPQLKTPPGPRMPTEGSKGFEPGMGRGRGAAPGTPGASR